MDKHKKSEQDDIEYIAGILEKDVFSITKKSAELLKMIEDDVPVLFSGKDQQRFLDVLYKAARENDHTFSDCLETEKLEYILHDMKNSQIELTTRIQQGNLTKRRAKKAIYYLTKWLFEPFFNSQKKFNELTLNAMNEIAKIMIDQQKLLHEIINCSIKNTDEDINDD